MALALEYIWWQPVRKKLEQKEQSQLHTFYETEIRKLNFICALSKRHVRVMVWARSLSIIYLTRTTRDSGQTPTAESWCLWPTPRYERIIFWLMSSINTEYRLLTASHINHDPMNQLMKTQQTAWHNIIPAIGDDREEMDVNCDHNFLTSWLILCGLASFLLGTSLHSTFADCVSLASREQQTPVVTHFISMVPTVIWKEEKFMFMHVMWGCFEFRCPLFFSFSGGAGVLVGVSSSPLFHFCIPPVP